MRISMVLRLCASMSCSASAICFFLALFYSPKSPTATGLLIAGVSLILITALSSFWLWAKSESTAGFAPNSNAGDQDSTETPTAEPAILHLQRKDVSGVGGWLLLLCIAWTIVGPIGSVLIIVGSLFVGNIFNTISFFLTGLFGVYAGYCLWAVKPKAVLVAKCYLWIMLIIYTIIPLQFGIFLTLEGMKPEVVLGAAMTSIFFAIWFSYFLFSKRVASTYATNSAIT